MMKTGVNTFGCFMSINPPWYHPFPNNLYPPCNLGFKDCLLALVLDLGSSK